MLKNSLHIISFEKIRIRYLSWQILACISHFFVCFKGCGSWIYFIRVSLGQPNNLSVQPTSVCRTLLVSSPIRLVSAARIFRIYHPHFWHLPLNISNIQRYQNSGTGRTASFKNKSYELHFKILKLRDRNLNVLLVLSGLLI